MTDFDPSMLAGHSRNVIDLSRFERGDLVLPGSYNLDVYMNGKWVGRMNVRFAAPSPNASAQPCITPGMMDRMGLKPQHAPEGFGTGKACVQMGQLISDATADFDQSDLRLDISVPQAYIGQMPRGYVSPKSWDAGIPAALLNYDLNAYHSSSQGNSQDSAYLGLRAGLNLGQWHLRQDSTLTWSSGIDGGPSRRRWQNIDAYVQRDLPSLKAALTIGDSYTDGAVFDSLGVEGIQLATDDRMRPESMRGYAPVVHGEARTNAKVTVTQNGAQLYQTTVAPGPFTINDLYPTGYGGDLHVTVTEADGRTHAFSVPYASVAQLLRKSTTRFDVAAGRLRNLQVVDEPTLLQATLQHGFSNFFTGYLGFQGSQGYVAALAGGAFNTRLGAFALDVTRAGSTIPGYQSMDGQSIRLSYSKIIPDTLTSISVAAYRYSSSGFLSLEDAARARDYAHRGLPLTQYLPIDASTIDGVPLNTPLTPAQRAMLQGTTPSSVADIPVSTGLVHRRNHFTLSLNQRLGDRFGTLYANASISDYWQLRGRDTQFQLGYNNSFHRISYNLSVSRSRTPEGRYDNRFYASINLPLGASPHAPNFSLHLSHDQQAGTEEQAMINGNLGRENQLNYGMTASHAPQGGGNAVSVNAGYLGPYATLSASFGKGSDYSQSSFNASGAIVAHAGGVTFGQPTSETVGIIHAPDAKGARVVNATGEHLDGNGYALVPYMNPYQRNTVRLDPEGLPLGVQLDSTSAEVAPYAGAVVMLDFKTQQGHALIARIRLPDGSPAPFGAEVDDTEGNVMGVVGQAGMALLRVKQDSGLLGVSWNGAQDLPHACRFDYAIPAASGSPDTYPMINVTCDAHSTAPSSKG